MGFYIYSTSDPIPPIPHQKIRKQPFSQATKYPNAYKYRAEEKETLSSLGFMMNLYSSYPYLGESLSGVGNRRHDAYHLVDRRAWRGGRGGVANMKS